MRQAHILKDNKSNQLPRYKVYIDTESRVINLKHYPYLAIACFIDTRYRKENWTEYENENIKNLWKDIANFGAKEKGSVYVYGHNVAYDLLATGGIPALLEEGFHVTQFFEKGLTFILVMRKTAVYKDKKGEEKEKVLKTLNFVSTTNYFSFPLATLGEIFGLEKLGFDYDEGTLEEAKIYCRRDVEICKKATETFTNFVIENELGTLAKTTPGQAFNAYRHKFMKEKIFLHDSAPGFEVERKAYYGGRVECFKIGRFEGNFYGYDINSMYPHVMNTNRYPVKLISVRGRNTLNEIASFIKNYGVIGEFTVKTEKPVFPLKLDNNLIFPVGTFKTYLSTPEIKYGLENNLIMAAGEVAVYEMENIFTDYVKYFYEKRLEAKKQKNKVYDLLFKLFLNALYGKFGQKSDNWQRVGDAPPEVIKAEEIINIETGEREVYKIFGGSIFKKGEEEEGFNSFCGIASHVTAYARMELLKYIELAGWENVLYMDTDSLFVNAEGSQNLERAGVVDSKILGLMKLEKHDTKIYIKAPKDYEFAGEKKMKGVKKGSEQVTDENILSELALKMNVRVSDLPERIYSNIQWPSLYTFIRAGNLSNYYNIRRTKILAGYYNKGWVLEGGNVKPFEMQLIYDSNVITRWENTSYCQFAFLEDPEQITRIMKRYKYYYEQDPEEFYQQMLEHERYKMQKEIRKIIMALGGVNDPDYEYLPRWCKRKKGNPLDVLADEVRERGFPVNNADELYDLITEF